MPIFCVVIFAIYLLCEFAYLFGIHGNAYECATIYVSNILYRTIRMPKILFKRVDVPLVTRSVIGAGKVLTQPHQHTIILVTISVWFLFFVLFFFCFVFYRCFGLKAWENDKIQFCIAFVGAKTLYVNFWAHYEIYKAK